MLSGIQQHFNFTIPIGDAYLDASPQNCPSVNSLHLAVLFTTVARVMDS